MLSGLAGDAKAGADLGPGVAAGAQALDRLGYGGVDLLGQADQEGQGLNITVPDAAAVRKPTSGRARREGHALTLDELAALMQACKGRYRVLVPMLALAGLRWGELSGLQVADRVHVPGPGLRLRRATLASGGGGALYVDTLKNNRSRTVPLVHGLVLIVDRWSTSKAPNSWLFGAPAGGPLRESNWKRSVGWSAATASAGLQGFPGPRSAPLGGRLGYVPCRVVPAAGGGGARAAVRIMLPCLPDAQRITRFVHSAS